MLPTNTITSTPIVSNFFGVYNNPYTPLSQIVYGGVALNDPSQGRMARTWRIRYSLGSIIVNPVGGTDVFALPVAGVKTVSLAFDNNMAVTIGYQTSGASNLYYFDAQANAFTTKVITSTTSCRVCLDDARDFNNTNSDVIFAYTKSNNLYWTQQRDRYLVERLVGATTGKLYSMGPNVENRFQFGLG